MKRAATLYVNWFLILTMCLWGGFALVFCFLLDLIRDLWLVNKEPQLFKTDYEPSTVRIAKGKTFLFKEL